MVGGKWLVANNVSLMTCLHNHLLRLNSVQAFGVPTGTLAMNESHQLINQANGLKSIFIPFKDLQIYTVYLYCF